MPLPGQPPLPSFAAGQTVGTAARLNQLRDAIEDHGERVEWEPTFNANLAGDISAAWAARIGQVIVFQMQMIVTGIASAGDCRISLPATPIATDGFELCSATYRDGSASANYRGVGYSTGSNAVQLRFLNTSVQGARMDGISSAAPFTWQNGVDRIALNGTYLEA